MTAKLNTNKCFFFFCVLSKNIITEPKVDKKKKKTPIFDHFAKIDPTDITSVTCNMHNTCHSYDNYCKNYKFRSLTVAGVRGIWFLERALVTTEL